MKKRSFKIGLIVVLVMLMIGLTYTSFAYWDDLTKQDDLTVTIGQGKTLEFSVELPDDVKLIPDGKVKGLSDVYKVVFVYTVKLDEKALVDLNLTADASEVAIGGDNTHSDLVNVEIEVGNLGKVNVTGTTVTVTVTIDEPVARIDLSLTDKQVYEAIKNKLISFKLTFSAAQ